MASHVVWALVAMLAYSFVAPFVRQSVTRGLPGFSTLLITSTILLIAAAGVAVASGDFRWTQLQRPAANSAYLAGGFLSVGIIAYYYALSTGPVSVVVPIFGMFLVLSPVAGYFLLEEALTPRKLAGIALAAVAVYLVVGGD
ncbi:EamA family transporter [Salisaeta longa]|uniref:EamA family transporter n=1 Tax=Salisaeta longa TaxID=503170 RepID=UPI0003B585EB|nr:EamA family transporter [Salisaeta longa]